MKRIIIICALCVFGAAATSLPGASKTNDILDYYRLLVQEKAIGDVLENKNGVWTVKTIMDGMENRSTEKPVVDVKNGYIAATYEVMTCRTHLELAYFISSDKRNFIAVSALNDCMEFTSYSFTFYESVNNKLVKLSQGPIKVSYKDLYELRRRRRTLHRGKCASLHHNLQAPARRDVNHGLSYGGAERPGGRRPDKGRGDEQLFNEMPEI